VLARPQFRLGLISLVVAFGWYAVFVYKPVIQGFWMSIENYQVLDPSASTFVGLKNFELLFTYDRFWIAVLNTVIYTVAMYVASVPISLLISWCIANVSWGRRFYEFVVFLPVVVSLVAISMLFRMLMNPDFGIFNRVLSAAHLPTSKWIFGSDSALGSVVVVDVWKGLGFYVVLLTAAMLAVPVDQQEAARVDGAGGWAVFRHVTVPAIMPTLALVSVFTVFNGLQVYVSPTVLGPGPGTSTLMLNQFIVDTAFTSFNLSLATAASVVLFLFVLVLTVIQLRVLRTRT
jgi:ABC-type sugar transport system permease subunit